MTWNLSFITKAEFTQHVKEVIHNYGDVLRSYNLEKFNRNIIDPIKMIFDKHVYQLSWEELIKNEIFRQRDKSNNNYIGYFHQGIFQYIDYCRVPRNGEEGGWDVIFQKPTGIFLPDNSVVHTVYVEMKNKHNTMNSAASSRTYMKMQDQLLHDDDCACFLVEAIATRSQNIQWNLSNMGHKLIRRVSLDCFYSLVTGDKDAFYKVCFALPEIIQEVIQSQSNIRAEYDTVIDEIYEIASKYAPTQGSKKDKAIEVAFFMLCFPTYLGFDHHN